MARDQGAEAPAYRSLHDPGPTPAGTRCGDRGPVVGFAGAAVRWQLCPRCTLQARAAAVRALAARRKGGD